ncbi:MAG: 3-deoxy-7-phosphoheptulonate synthase, partial [Pseudomonadota bacterium]
IVDGNQSIIGFMIESHINAGNQKASNDMKYGVSITDGCIDWETTERSIRAMRDALKDVLPSRNQRA